MSPEKTDLVFSRSREIVRDSLQDTITAQQSAQDQLVEPVAAAGRSIRNALRSGRRVLVFGNGGSAGDAQHLAGELVGRFERERGPLPAVALTTDTSTLTAIANDYGFDHVFERQIHALGDAGDIAIAISTSGRSKNVLLAVQAARDRGMHTIGLTGQDGAPLAEICDVALQVPSSRTARIQEVHLAILHALCTVVDSDT